MLFRKLGKSDSSKTCIPGSFPEGKPGGTGRQTGRRFPSSMFSGPELERETRGFQPASPRKISRLPGRETEGDPEGKISKGTFSKQLPRDPADSRLCFPAVSRQEVDNIFKTTESRKVPGREKGVSRKANWKGYF